MFNLVHKAKRSKDAAGNTSAFVKHDPGSLAQRGQATVSDQSQPTRVRYNTEAPPSVAFASGNPYLDRPLPAPPTQKVTMLVRPNTSGGSSSRSQVGSDFSKFNKYDRRISRDDFYLSMKPRAGTGFKPQFATFSGQLPTPEGSPRSKVLSRPTIPIVRMPTPDSIDDISAPIGMALGSPTHQPVGWGTWSSSSHQTLRPEPVQVVNPTSPLSSVESVDPHDVPKEKKQPPKRRLFGLFSRRNTDQSQAAVSISEPNQLGQTSQVNQAGPKPSNIDQARPGRSNTSVSQKFSRHKPIVIRSQTMPYEKGQASKAKSTVFRSRNPSVDTYGSSNPHERSTSNFGSIPIVLQPPPQASGPAPGLLNVAIPESSLERYSVMFQEVLEEQPSNSSALLARRQATVRELRKISDAVAAEKEERLARPRRVTSPQPRTKSPGPSFALFPSTPSGRNSSQQLSHPQPRVVRSNTSPALLPSPSRETFDLPQQPHQKEPEAAHHHISRMAIPTTARTTSQPAPIWVPAPTHGFNFDPEQSGLILESPTDVESPTLSPDIIRSTIVKPKIQEPDWQIIEPSTHTTTTTTTTNSSVTSSRKRSPSSATASSSQSHATKPSFDLMDEPDDIFINRDPVEISIARQISISRQQRKLLQPLQTSFSVRSRAGSAKGSPPVPRIAIGVNERLAETRTATPTIVTPDETFETLLLQHRKSEHIRVEDY
ncbi:hypothetical protein BKA67DRAFT_653863 [Truncatella angustata]|uniref:Uncharacterized protein n=1 Tax=Truncatella angustata TaxID=152316 RepID=A0A9P8UYG8_9PEZI|nr:uncharacterized protein BKA67DRAFT_653863 [Truncatella angustata]KAH6660700.1 hypothetical protein BKA67DRAFT_653863 [Truncatella angustata]